MDRIKEGWLVFVTRDKDMRFINRVSQGPCVNNPFMGSERKGRAGQQDTGVLVTLWPQSQVF